jgi:hypothetical protein
VPELSQRLLARYVMGFPQRDVDAMVGLMGKLREGHLTHLTDDVERVLGRPAITFTQFAEDHASILRK